MEPDHIRAHKFSIRHQTYLMSSDVCGCFYCLAIFSPSVITKWIVEPTSDEKTACCPSCGIDAVIGSAAGFPILKDFLERMRNYWF
jgi:hypothetical protein